ncbi:MAG: alpha/beta fold hydrolase [Methanobrevibacter sp.]|uniref:alpha/beta fold hydrolase n=1 Tax=Methanobrevibacter sp. TaxID=66852 RepID=UPI0026DEEABA|nr:alpha/beta fold hydrolase [Methanobrevibacter sp.]MDO5848957.1 alpha/beta fold hydrolase [Methanobrevibacter sp.]
MNTFLNNLDYFYLDNFEFTNGKTMENAKVEYVTGGTPKYDDDGRITNAIVYCHGSGGNYGSIKKLNDLINPGDPFDKEEYFFISMSGLGTPESCSPSTTELFYRFPRYSLDDMVNFQKQFLEECFNITHVKGVIGNSMGGYVALTWATLYPDYMDFIISIVSSYKTAGHNYILSKVTNEIITSDPHYGVDGYSESLSRTLKLATQVAYSYGLSRQQYRGMSNYELDVAIDDYGDEGLFADIYDVKYQNDAILEYDIEEDLEKIEADVLIIAINQDQYFPPDLDAIPLNDMIENSQLVIFDSLLGHVGSNELIKIKDDLQAFMLKHR